MLSNLYTWSVTCRGGREGNGSRWLYESFLKDFCSSCPPPPNCIWNFTFGKTTLVRRAWWPYNKDMTICGVPIVHRIHRNIPVIIKFGLRCSRTSIGIPRKSANFFLDSTNGKEMNIYCTADPFRAESYAMLYIILLRQWGEGVGVKAERR